MKTISYKNVWVLVCKKNRTIWNNVANARNKNKPKINNYDRAMIGSVSVPPFTPLIHAKKWKNSKTNRPKIGLQH